jgi:hypothetical protein
MRAKVLGRKHPERHCRDPQLSAPVQDIVELVGATLVDFTWVAQASMPRHVCIILDEPPSSLLDLRAPLLNQLKQRPMAAMLVSELPQARSGGLT